MKKFLLTLAIVGISFASFAQGTLNFNNKVGTTVDAKVSRLSDGTGAGAGITAQLALVAPGGSLTFLLPTTTFKTATAGQKFYVTAPLSFVVPGTAAGQSINVRMLAWETSFGSYDAAKSANGLTGFSNDISVVLGGPVAGAPDALPGNLLGLQSFTISGVPEPTTYALLGLGGLALAIRRRK